MTRGASANRRPYARDSPGNPSARSRNSYPKPARQRRAWGTASLIVRSPSPRASAPRTSMANVLLNPSGGSIVRPVAAYWSRTVSSTARLSRATGFLKMADSAVPGVLDVHVDLAGPHRAVADERAAEVEPPVDRQPAVPLEGLRHELAEQDLLGEVLRPDDDCARAPRRERERDGGEGHQQERASARAAVDRPTPAPPARAPLQQRERAVRKQRERGRRHGSREDHGGDPPSTGRGRCTRRARRPRSPPRSSPCPRRPRSRRGCRPASRARRAAARQPQQLERPHAHRERRLAHSRIDALKARDRGPHDRQHGIEHQRDDRRARADPADEGQRQQEPEERQAGDRLNEVGEPENRRTQPRALRGDDAERDGERQRRGCREHDERHVLRHAGGPARRRAPARTRAASPACLSGIEQAAHAGVARSRRPPRPCPTRRACPRRARRPDRRARTLRPCRASRSRRSCAPGPGSPGTPRAAPRA